MNSSIKWTSPGAWVSMIGVVLWAYILVSTAALINQPFPGFRVGYCNIVSVFNESRWSGIQAGLKSGDIVLGVDGHRAPQAQDVFQHANRVPVGTPVRYDILRDGKMLVVTAPTQTFSLLDFVVSFGVFFAIGFVALLVGSAAALKRPDNPAAQANLWLSTGLSFYFVTSNDYDLAQLLHPSLYWAANVLIGSAALSMALNFPEPPAWAERRPWVKTLPYAIGAALLAFVAWQFIRLGASPDAELAAMSVINWPTLVLLISFPIFFLRLKGRQDVRQRNQIKVLLLGMAAAYLPMLVVNLNVLPGMAEQGPLYISVANACWVLFPLSLAYAIVKHGMFDITVIIKRTTIYASLTAFLVGGYFATAAAIRWLASWLVGAGQTSDWENVLATAIIAVAFMPVRQWITARVDRHFSRTKYDFKAVVAAVTSKAQSTLDINDMKRQFMHLIDQALHPKYIYILTLVPQGDLLTTMGEAATWGEPPMPDFKVAIDDPLFQHTERHQEMRYLPSTGTTGRLSPLAALGQHYRVPLLVNEEVVGLVILGPKKSDEEYDAEDEALLAATRLPLATAIKTAALVDAKLANDRLEQELERARAVQVAMLPRQLPNLPGFDFAASSVPCYEASGDYYDFLELPDGRLGLAVADVAGKGIGAAMATAMAKSALYNQTQTDPEVIPVLGALNRVLHSVSKHSAAKSFTTCLYALLEPEAMRLTYAAAGHFPPVYYDASLGRVVEFPIVGGFPLGVRENSKYAAQGVQLHPGDVLVFFTDGVTEAQAPLSEDGEMFETDRLSDMVRAHHDRSAAEIHAAIQQAVADFVAGGPQTDDITLVVLKVLPS